MASEIFSSLKGSYREEIKPTVLGDAEAFLRALQKSAEHSSVEDISATLQSVEAIAKHPDRTIECYTDPTLETFCCAQVPARRVDEEGNIVDDLSKKQYLIGIPFLYVAGKAPDSFLQGEIDHEVGHALYTDWTLMTEFRERAEREGYDPQEALELNNCVEDARMERVAGGPIRPGVQADLFEKNRTLIIPSIAKNIAAMTPPEQFRFLLKLEGLWRVYSEQLAGVEKPWSLQSLHPDVQEAFAQVESSLERITGDAHTPALKLSREYRRLFVESIWPAYKKLIDTFPDKTSQANTDADTQEPSQKSPSSDGGRGENQSSKSGEQGNEHQRSGTEDGGDAGRGQENNEGAQSAVSEKNEGDMEGDGGQPGGEEGANQNGNQSGEQQSASGQKQGTGGDSREGSEQVSSQENGQSGENSTRGDQNGSSGEGASGNGAESGERGQSPRNGAEGSIQSTTKEGAESNAHTPLKRGARSRRKEEVDPESDDFNPGDPSTWPPQLQKFFQYMLSQHQARLERQAANAKAEHERRNNVFATYQQAEHETLKRRDGFEDPHAREKYRELSADAQPTMRAIARIFRRFFPKSEDPEEEWGRRGKRFDVQRLARAYGTGKERPIGKREHPQETKFLLQIIVDVSGSMYSDGPESRIKNAVEGCIALSEAAQKTNVDVEILASDEGNVTTDRRYLIKGFDEKFFGPVKERIVGMLTGFGGDNEDAASIRAAVERLKKAALRAKSDADRVGTLIIFITDSTTTSESTRAAVADARAITPLEGLAITDEPEVADCVRNHFGPESVIPKTIAELPKAIQTIVERNVSKFIVR